MKRSFDAAVFTKNRQRLLAHDAGRVLFNEGLLSDEYFSVDGTLIETAASLKSFRSKEGPPPLSDDDPGTPAWTSEMFTRDSPWMWPGKATATAPQPNGGPQTFVCETGTASAAHIH